MGRPSPPAATARARVSAVLRERRAALGGGSRTWRQRDPFTAQPKPQLVHGHRKRLPRTIASCQELGRDGLRARGRREPNLRTGEHARGNSNARLDRWPDLPHQHAIDPRRRRRWGRRRDRRWRDGGSTRCFRPQPSRQRGRHRCAVGCTIDGAMAILASGFAQGIAKLRPGARGVSRRPPAAGRVVFASRHHPRSRRRVIDWHAPIIDPRRIAVAMVDRKRRAMDIS